MARHLWQALNDTLKTWRTQLNITPYRQNDVALHHAIIELQKKIVSYNVLYPSKEDENRLVAFVLGSHLKLPTSLHQALVESVAGYFGIIVDKNMNLESKKSMVLSELKLSQHCPLQAAL